MRVRVFSLLLALFTIPTLAFADAHKSDYYGGGSGGTGGSNLLGFTQSIAWGLPGCHWCSFVGPDVSVQFGGHQGKDLTQVAYQVGFRATLTRMMDDMRHKDSQSEDNDKPFKLFVQVMFGAAYTNDGTDQSGNNGVRTFGGGFQYFPSKQERPKKTGGTVSHFAGLGVQGQVDYIWRTDRDSFVRVSGGVVYRFLHDSY